MSLDCPNAKKAAIRVLMLSTMIMTFIPRSNNPYLPKDKSVAQIKVITTPQYTILDEMPNSSTASPAVTIVTAVCIVNMVRRVRTK